MNPTNRTDEVAREVVRRPFKHPETGDDFDILGWVQMRELSIAVAEPELISRIASAIQSAVEAERERCAKLADEFDDYAEIHEHRQSAFTKNEIAKSIRQTPTREGV